MESRRLVDSSVADRAEQAADRAARNSEVSVLIIEGADDLRAVNDLFAEIWAADGADPVMNTSILTALTHTGNYVAGAFRRDQVVGGSVGFLGRRDSHMHLHSHMTGIAPSQQGRSIGFALKQHQRAWALFQGIDEVTWTFDPLVGRNGYFNISKLGAEIVDYHENFYGRMSDAVNRDDESDRCLVAWDLRSDRVVAAAEGQGRLATADLSEAKPLLDKDTSGMPVLTRVEAAVLTALVPKDIVRVRAERPDEAVAWRRALRSGLRWALARGYTVTSMTRDGRYVLTRPE
ncbi:MAG: hypothetical protein QOC87_720 [Actinomycetota bacterium]|nr:hypothetical protein [Actinomycetota bacterium]